MQQCTVYLVLFLTREENNFNDCYNQKVEYQLQTCVKAMVRNAKSLASGRMGA